MTFNYSKDRITKLIFNTSKIKYFTSRLVNHLTISQLLHCTKNVHFCFQYMVNNDRSADFADAVFLIAD